MASLKVLHLSHMPELDNIGPRALNLLNILEEFHCTHNNKLRSIDPTAFSYKLNDGSDGESWPRIVKVSILQLFTLVGKTITFEFLCL